MSKITKMFQEQENLIKLYQTVYDLPEFPMNIDSRVNQKQMREFIEFFFEEISEAQEEYYNAMRDFGQNIQAGEVNPEIVLHLDAFNEEISDTFHFLLEILIFSNIDENDLVAYFNKVTEGNIQVVKGKELEFLLDCSKLVNSKDPLTSDENTDNRRAKDVTYLLNYHKNQAGNLLGSTQRMLNSYVLLFRTMHAFQKAKNCLKNKPWKQTDVPTDTQKFQEFLLEGTLCYFRYLQFMRATPTGISQGYITKNKKNQQRIKSQY